MDSRLIGFLVAFASIVSSSVAIVLLRSAIFEDDALAWLPGLAALFASIAMPIGYTFHEWDSGEER